VCVCVCVCERERERERDEGRERGGERETVLIGAADSFNKPGASARRASAHA
jgi:hypothetical protein